MGSLDYVELLENPRYRKFLHQALPEIGHTGIIHFLMTPVLHSAKVDSSRGFLEISRNHNSPWTTNIWFRPLISRNSDFLLPKLQGFILTLLEFARPEMKITDSELGDAYFDHHRQFIGDLVVLPWTEPRVEEDFELHVYVRLYISRSEKAVQILEKSVRMELTFKKVWIVQVLSYADTQIPLDGTLKLVLAARSGSRSKL